MLGTPFASATNPPIHRTIFLIMFTCMAGGVGGGTLYGTKRNMEDGTVNGMTDVLMDGMPRFQPNQKVAVTSEVGNTVELNCLVDNLGSHTVSWVRARDLQILTYAGDVFTADVRVSALARLAGSLSTHTLRLAGARPADAGSYECQLNTEPKSSLVHTLRVVPPGTMDDEEDYERVVLLGALDTGGGMQKDEPPSTFSSNASSHTFATLLLTLLFLLF